MPTDNVVPIDADAARVLARRSIRFRWFVAASVSVWLAMVVPVVLLTPLPPLAPFLVLAALLVLSEHRFVLFGDETSMSGGMVIVIASVFVFSESAAFAGPVLVASLGGLFMPHFQSRRFGLVVANCSIFATAVACACVVNHAVDRLPLSSTTTIALAVIATVAAYWVANSTLIGVATSARHGTGAITTIHEQVTSNRSVIFLAAAAALAGIAGSAASAPELIVLMITPLAAFELRIMAQRQPSVGHAAPVGDPRVVMLCTMASLLLATTTVAGASLAFVALFLAVTFHQPLHAIAASVVVSTSAGALAAVVLREADVPTVGQAVVVAILMFALVPSVEIGSRMVRTAAPICPYTLLGAAIPSARDLPTIATAAFVPYLVMFGINTTGLFIASGVVVAAAGISSFNAPSRNTTPDHDAVNVP